MADYFSSGENSHEEILAEAGKGHKVSPFAGLAG
jgi:hypothetical protein